MPFTVTMPKLSPTMEAGVIAKWHKNEGDKVESGDLLLEITTDKATVEHNALDEGFLRKVLTPEGSNVSINQPIAIFTEEESESIEGYQPEGLVPAAPEPAQETQEESQEVEEAKSAPQTSSAAAASFAQPVFEPEPPFEDYQLPVDIVDGRIPASPLAKKIAKEKNLDLSTVRGSGPGGRIMSEDLDFAPNQAPASFGATQVPTQPSGSYQEESMSPVQQVVANRLQASKTFIPHFYLNQNIRVCNLIRLRKQLQSQNLKVSYNDFVIRALALALREHPHVNSGINSVNQTLIRFKTIDISVAVSLDEGLITPIIRYADYKNLGQISMEVKRLAKKARDGKLAMEEFKGGSFTISNLGMYGTTEVKPIINPPQAGILGVGGIQEVAVVENGQLVPGHQMTLTLAADHRAINGEDGAKFLKTLKELLENPAILLV